MGPLDFKPELSARPQVDPSASTGSLRALATGPGHPAAVTASARLRAGTAVRHVCPVNGLPLTRRPSLSCSGLRNEL